MQEVEVAANECSAALRANLVHCLGKINVHTRFTSIHERRRNNDCEGLVDVLNAFKSNDRISPSKQLAEC